MYLTESPCFLFYSRWFRHISEASSAYKSRERDRSLRGAGGSTNSSSAAAASTGASSGSTADGAPSNGQSGADILTGGTSSPGGRSAYGESGEGNTPTDNTNEDGARDNQTGKTHIFFFALSRPLAMKKGFFAAEGLFHGNRVCILGGDRMICCNITFTFIFLIYSFWGVRHLKGLFS